MDGWTYGEQDAVSYLVYIYSIYMYTQIYVCMYVNMYAFKMSRRTSGTAKTTIL